MNSFTASVSNHPNKYSALGRLLSWLECCPNISVLWAQSPVGAQTGVDHWMHGLVGQQIDVSLSQINKHVLKSEYCTMPLNKYFYTNIWKWLTWTLFILRDEIIGDFNFLCAAVYFQKFIQWKYITFIIKLFQFCVHWNSAV